MAENEPAPLIVVCDAGPLLGLVAHGTIGVLLRAIRRQQKTKDEIVRLLRSLPTASTLHIRTALLEEIIREVEQSH